MNLNNSLPMNQSQSVSSRIAREDEAWCHSCKNWLSAELDFYTQKRYGKFKKHYIYRVPQCKRCVREQQMRYVEAKQR